MSSVAQANEKFNKAKDELKDAKNLKNAMEADRENRERNLKMSKAGMTYARISVTRSDPNDKADIYVAGPHGAYTLKPGKEVVIPSALLNNFNDAVETRYRQEVDASGKPFLEPYENPRFNVKVIATGLEYKDYLEFLKTQGK